jgi:hypothetical protein
MNRNNLLNQNKNKRDATNKKARKATFAENVEQSDADTNMTNDHTTSKSINKSHQSNNNNTHKQKKQKQNNNNNIIYNNNSNQKDKSKVTAYFVSGPARSTERVKNSRASQLKNSTGRKARKGASTEITFNFKHRYDVNITLHATTLDARLIELQRNIDELMAIIIDEDKNAKLLPWKASKQDRHPAITSSDETTGSFADIYLSRSWLGNLESKHKLYMKLYIGHDKSYYDHILPALEDWNSHTDRNMKYCMLQAEETTFIGWFLYSTLSIDAGALADAIYDEYNIEVGLRWMDIRMSTIGKKQSNKSKPVKAIHVETEKSKSRSIMEILMKCYGRNFDTTRNFPNGIRLRFCKNLDNATYKMEKTKLINLRSRQKQLLAETNRTTSAGILDLDVILKEETTINEETSVTTTTTTNLREAIMTIQSKYVPNTPLFRSVDLAYDSEEYVFAYHQSMADEAKAMVDYLYPYLEHLYDKKALKKAFDSVYIKEMTSFKYNLITDQVEDTIAESSYDMMKNDKITGNQNFMEFDLSALSLEEESTRPQASILGKMYSGQDSISTQHHAGRIRAPQNTTEDILEITPDELKELQHAMLLHTQTKNKTSERKNVLHIANLDTNTILKQIRMKNKEKGNQTVRGNDAFEEIDTEGNKGGKVDLTSNDEDDDEQEENYHEAEEQLDDDDDEMGMMTDSNEEESDNQSDLSDDDEAYEDYDTAKNHEKTSQFNVRGDEPPTPSREGGSGL